jgi:hypothetical protein
MNASNVIDANCSKVNNTDNRVTKTLVRVM